MSNALVPVSPNVTAADLEAEGFAPEQIARLEALRERYPVIEFSESDQEVKRLELMRWMYQNGRLNESGRKRAKRAR